MFENTILLDLFYHRPHSFLLLSYLKLIAEDKKTNQFVFWPKDLRTIGSRTILTKEQVRRNLKLLHERGLIRAEKLKYPKNIFEITLIQNGKFHV